MLSSDRRNSSLESNLMSDPRPNTFCGILLPEELNEYSQPAHAWYGKLGLQLPLGPGSEALLDDRRSLMPASKRAVASVEQKACKVEGLTALPPQTAPGAPAPLREAGLGPGKRFAVIDLAVAPCAVPGSCLPAVVPFLPRRPRLPGDSRCWSAEDPAACCGNSCPSIQALSEPYAHGRFRLWSGRDLTPSSHCKSCASVGANDCLRKN